MIGIPPSNLLSKGTRAPRPFPPLGGVVSTPGSRSQQRGGNWSWKGKGLRPPCPDSAGGRSEGLGQGKHLVLWVPEQPHSPCAATSHASAPSPCPLQAPTPADAELSMAFTSYFTSDLNIVSFKSNLSARPLPGFHPLQCLLSPGGPACWFPGSLCSVLTCGPLSPATDP